MVPSAASYKTYAPDPSPVCYFSLDLFQHLNVLLEVSDPGLNTAVEVKDLFVKSRGLWYIGKSGKKTQNIIEIFLAGLKFKDLFSNYLKIIFQMFFQ